MPELAVDEIDLVIAEWVRLVLTDRWVDPRLDPRTLSLRLRKGPSYVAACLLASAVETMSNEGYIHCFTPVPLSALD